MRRLTGWTRDGRETVLRAGSQAGIFRAVQTLLQLFPPAVFSRSPRVGIAWNLPFVRIADRPRFAWRGTMLDVSRHFATVEFLHRFLDAMAMHKLNIFHWHLTDDQGWRIEMKKFPLLTEVGSFRRETLFGHYDVARGGMASPTRASIRRSKFAMWSPTRRRVISRWFRRLICPVTWRQRLRPIPNSAAQASRLRLGPSGGSSRTGSLSIAGV